MEAKGKEDPHRQKRNKQAEDSDDVPEFGVDYNTFGQEEEEDDKAAMIVGRDRDTLQTFAHLCRCKGPGDEWVVDRLVEDIESLGHTKVTAKTDGEPALVKFYEFIKGK